MTKEELRIHVRSFHSLLSTVRPTSRDETHRNNLRACYNELDKIYSEMEKLGISNYNMQWSGANGHTGKSQIYEKLKKKDLTDALGMLSSQYNTIINELTS